VPIGEFVRSFAGLSSTAKAKTVCAELSAVGHLSDFAAHRELVGVLLSAMQANSRAPKPSVLGQVPSTTTRRALPGGSDWCTAQMGRLGSGSSGPRSPTAPSLGSWRSPWPRPSDRGSCSTRSTTPRASTIPRPARVGCRRSRLDGAASFLRQLDAYPDGSNNRAAAIHLISPAVSFLDKGKCTLALR